MNFIRRTSRFTSMGARWNRCFICKLRH